MRCLYLDFDGVLFDTVKFAFAEMKNIGVNLKDDDAITEYFKKVDWNYLINNGGVLNNSIEKIKQLIDSNEFEIVEVATHRCTFQEGVIKTNDLKNRIPELKVTTIPKNIKKHHALNSRGNILIDDAKEKILTWIEDGGIGILFSQNVDHLIYPYELGDNNYFITNDLLDALTVNNLFKEKTYRKTL